MNSAAAAVVFMGRYRDAVLNGRQPQPEPQSYQAKINSLKFRGAQCPCAVQRALDMPTDTEGVHAYYSSLVAGFADVAHFDRWVHQDIEEHKSASITTLMLECVAVANNGIVKHAEIIKTLERLLMRAG